MNKKEIIEEVVVSDSASTRTSTMTNNALSAAGELVRLTYLPGNTVSSVARAHGIAPSVLFRWRALDKQGSLTAIQTGEGTVSAKKYEAALEEIKRLQRLLGQATADNALLKDAVEYMQSKKWIAR